MKTDIVYRENHNENLEKERSESYKIYTPHYEDMRKKLDFLSELLKNKSGHITLSPEKESWYSHKITIDYNGFSFDVGADYKGKLQVYSKDLALYHSPTVYDKEKEEFIKNNKPLSYTFNKLSTKKLLEVFEYYIKLIELSKKLTNDKEKTNLALYDSTVLKICFIAEHLNLETKQRIDHSKKEFFVYAPFGRIEVVYSFYDRAINFSYDIEKYIQMIKTIKKDV